MDRRQRKTREAIFGAFSQLLNKKDFSKITVGEIIEAADVGRATFYSHFETKEYLLKEFCEELFCHVFDTALGEGADHRHIFHCEGEESVFLHLLKHLYNNDNNVMTLLSSRNKDLFLKYFKAELAVFAYDNYSLFECERYEGLPQSFVINHIVSSFTETVRWWTAARTVLPPETVAEYFAAVL